MPVGALIGGGLGLAGSVGSSLIGANASKNAANAQVQLGQQALGQQLGLFDQAKGVLNPIIAQGSNIVNGVSSTLSNLLTPGPNQTSTLSQIPGFQFAQDWGQKAVQNIGTTTGLGGNVLTAGANFATGLAQNGFNGIVGALQNFLGTGANLETGPAGALAGAATQTGGQVGNTLTGIGNATASGILGSANAISGGITGGANSATNALLLSKLFGGGSTPLQGSLGGIYGGTSNPTFGPVSVGGAPLGG